MVATHASKGLMKKIIIRIAVLTGLCLLVFLVLPGESYAAQRCSTVPSPMNSYVDAVVYVPIYNTNGTFSRYSKDFTVKVTTIDYYGVLSPLPRGTYSSNPDDYLNLGIQNSSSPMVDGNYVDRTDERVFRVDLNNGEECYPMGGAAGRPENGSKLIFSDSDHDGNSGTSNKNPWLLDCAFFPDEGHGLIFRFELISVNDLGSQAYNITGQSYITEELPGRSANGVGYRVGEGQLGVQLSSYPSAIINGWKTDMATKASNIQNQPFSNARIVSLGEITRESTTNPYGLSTGGWVLPTRDLTGNRTWVRLQAPDPPPAGWRLVGYTKCDQDDVDAGRFTRTQVDDTTCNRAKDPRANAYNDDTAGFQPAVGNIHIWWFYEPIPPPSPNFGPWLQTRGGDILSWNKVVGQPEGALGSRPVVMTNTGPSDATNVIMAYMNGSSVGTNTGPFCSDNLYALGARQTVDSSGNRGACSIGKYEFSIITSPAGDPRTNAFVKKSGMSTTLDLVRGSNGEDADGMVDSVSTIWDNNDHLSPPPSGSNCGDPNGVSGLRYRTFRLAQLRQSNSDITRSDFSVSNPANSTQGTTAAARDSAIAYGTISCTAGVLLRTHPSNSSPLTIGDTTPPQSCAVNSGNNLYFDKGGRLTVWADVNGNNTKDVYIRTNVCTAVQGSGYQDFKNLPQMAIVATGNVYIDPDVTDLHTSIYAVGKIYTCYRSGEGVGAEDYYKQNGGNKNCDKQLRIRGSVAGRSGIVWGRKYYRNPSSLNDSAEQVIASGQFLAAPPVGWGVWNDANDSRSSIRYMEGNLSPRF